MPTASDRRALLTAALGFVQLQPQTAALRALHAWLDAWGGVAAVAIGMGRQGFDLTLEYRDASTWHASFDRRRLDNFSPAAPLGYASAPTPWQAVRWAAWQVVQRLR
jgi:hypothetical protein